MRSDSLELLTPHGVCRLALKRGGSGASTLFLHGWAHTSLVWQDVISRNDSSGEWITVDLPGFGASPPLPPNRISLASYAEIVWELLAYLSKDNAIRLVVADSMSGLLVLDCLSRFQTLPTRSYFISGVPLDGLPKLIRDTHAHAFTGSGLRLLRGLPFFVANFLTTRSNHLTVHQRGHFERIITEMVRATDPGTAGRLLREMYYPYKLTEQFEPARYQIDLCRGAHDLIFRETALSPWAQALSARPVTLANAGHTPMLEAPNDYARAVHDAWERSAETPVQGR